MSDKDKIYSSEEEKLNIISHAIGIAGAVAVGAYFLSLVIAKGGDAWDIASIILYIIGMLGSFICSIKAFNSSAVSTLNWLGTISFCV